MASNNQLDIISNLPQDVIRCILERLHTKDAVKTSALSKSWRYSWQSITKLVFFADFFSEWKTLRGYQTHEHIALVQKFLGQHDGRLHTVAIDVPYYACSDYPEIVKTILKFVSSKGVECLTITMRSHNRNNSTLTPLFSCSELTNLTIENCNFFVPVSSFRGFPRLVNLKFEHVGFYDNSLEDLMNNCPLLESLSLVWCYWTDNVTTIIIPCPGLKHLNISSHIRFTTLTIVSHNLESLFVSHGWRMADEYRLILPPTSQNSLKKISFEHVDSNLQVSLATNVLDIEISFTQWASWDDEIRKFVKLLKVSIGQMQLRHVEYLKMKLQSGCEEVLDIVNMFLSETPSLNEIVVVDRSYKYESEDKHNCRRQSIQDKLQFCRLSPRAQLVLRNK